MTDTIDPGRKLFFGLFVFPLLIAVGMAVLLCSVVLITHEDATPETLLVSLKKSPLGKRWQKAFELSNEINRAPEKSQNQALAREMIQILQDKERFDAKTRAYMALALARQNSPEAVPALENALTDPEEEVRVFAIWSLGLVGRRDAAPAVQALLKDDSPEIRKTASYVLGSLGSKSSCPALRGLLQDAVADVRWNAALALSRLGNADGYDVLLSMLERRRLSGELSMGEPQIEAAMINASKGLALLHRPESVKILETVSKEDRNLKVRQAALVALQHLERVSA